MKTPVSHQRFLNSTRFMSITFCFFVLTCFRMHAQSPAADSLLIKTPAVNDKASPLEVVPVTTTCYLPVYFNYRRRQLKYNGMERLNAARFLELCKTVPDSSVQSLVALFFQLKHKKQAQAAGAAIGGASGGILLMGAFYSLLLESQSDVKSGMLAITGLAVVMIAPMMGIWSSILNARQKAILFRDLPVAYNSYVEHHRAHCTACQTTSHY